MSVSQWMFPPLADPTFFPNNYLSNNIVAFLNTSTTFWPSSGWGKTAVYSNDSVTFQVQNQTFASIGFIGQLHCMPCRQRLDSSDEALNWDACRYGRADTLADLISTQIAFPSRPARSFITAKWNVNMANPLPEATANQALMCTVGLPGSSAYELSKPFRLINSARSSPVTYEFDSAQPEGQRMATPTPGGSAPTATAVPVPGGDADHSHQHTGLRSAQIAGIVVGAGLAGVGIFFAICWFIFKRKRSTKSPAVATKDAMAKEEEAAGDILPSYEKPPEYVEVQPATK